MHSENDGPRLGASPNRPVFWLLLVLIATLAPLALAEGILRLRFGQGLSARELALRLESSRTAPLTEHHGKGLYGLVQASLHHDMVYELKPNLVGTFRGQSLRTNSRGLRDSEDLPLAKPPGTFRIVGLGDSHMFGWGVGQEESYLHQLEEILNGEAPKGMRVEAINCAVPGYNTTMEVATFEHKCQAYEPDLVLLHFISNDFGLPHFLQPPRGFEPQDWYLTAFLKALFAGADSEPRELLPHDRSQVEPEVRQTSRREHAYLVGRDAYRRAIARLAALTEDPPVPVMMVILGTSSPERRFAVRIARRNGFEIMSQAPAFDTYLIEKGLERTRATWKQTFLIPNDGHVNAIGHRLYAEALAQEILPRVGN